MAMTAAILLCLLVSFLFAGIKKTQEEKKEARFLKNTVKKAPPQPPKNSAPCPVCRSMLGEGEKVYSTARRLSDKEKLLHISGCPRCLYGDARRVCPVCGAELTRDEILAAKMDVGAGGGSVVTNGSTVGRVKIFGCSRCGSALAKDPL